MIENRTFSYTGWVIVYVTKGDGSYKENKKLLDELKLGPKYFQWKHYCGYTSLVFRVSKSVSTEDIDKEIPEQQRRRTDERAGRRTAEVF